MAIIRRTLTAGAALTRKQKAEIRAAAKRPYVHDPDCPLVTQQQAPEFKPVDGMSWEERERLMHEHGIIEPLVIETDLTAEERAIIAEGRSSLWAEVRRG